MKKKATRKKSFRKLRKQPANLSSETQKAGGLRETECRGRVNQESKGKAVPTGESRGIVRKKEALPCAGKKIKTY